MNVLHLSTYDFGGAAKAAIRIHTNLSANGYRSKMIVLKKQNNNNEVISVEDYKTIFEEKKRENVILCFGGQSNPDYCFFDRNILQPINISLLLSHINFKPDIIIAHWISNFLTVADLHQLQKETKAPIIWFLMDMAPLTGGCHYAWNCSGYINQCGNCPALYSNDPNDFSFQYLKFKSQYINDMDITVIAGTSWLENQAKQSTLFKNKKIVKMMLGVDTEIFKPQSKEIVRKNLNLPTNKKIIFFGAEYINEKRKGMSYLIEALKKLTNTSYRNDVLLLSVGKSFQEELKSNPLFDYIHVNYIDNRDDLLAALYQSADVFICPSVEDSGPMMINEAIMCGTPVVSFEMGASLDLVFSKITGYRAKLKDSEDLAKGINYILSLSPEQIKKISEQCRELGLHLCSPQVQIESFKNLFNELSPNYEIKPTPIKPKLLNLGCGNIIRKDWVHIDFTSRHKEVIAHNLRKGIPFPDNEFDGVYHSHVLEHFAKDEALLFIKECFRVLKIGGIIRVVVPDLEGIVKEYLKWMDSAYKGLYKADSNYEWIMLELFDQTVRNYSGGEMGKYLAQENMPNKEFIAERIGDEFIEQFNTNNFKMVQNNIVSQQQALSEDTMCYNIGRFRMGGEIHQWMYDRYSLSRLLKQAGFVKIEIKTALESNISDFNKYELDTYKGKPRGASSLFVEAFKPKENN